MPSLTAAPVDASVDKSEVVGSSGIVLVRLGLFGQSSNLALLKRYLHGDVGQFLQQYFD
jgi:hypothetical protein